MGNSLKKDFFEDDLYPKLISLVDKHIISDVQPQWFKNIGYFYLTVMLIILK